MSHALTHRQKILIKAVIGDNMPTLRKYNFFDLFSAIFFVIKTGCQWQMLPSPYPHWKMVYHHFRSWSDKGWFAELLKLLVVGKRCSMGLDAHPTEMIIDSESIRSGLPHSVKGVDGYKRIKGIKRHLSVDEMGYPLNPVITTANIHDLKAAYMLIPRTLSAYSNIRRIKADNAYRGDLEWLLPSSLKVELQCVKSNIGTPDFIPMHGRWVVERTFSWMGNYRRLTRNFEQHLHMAHHIYVAALMFFMLRYFR